MKNQIEILKELFREVLGTISIEEFMENKLAHRQRVEAEEKKEL